MSIIERITTRAKQSLRIGRKKVRAARSSGPVIETTEGPVQGRLKDSGRIAHFAGIPYAAPPVGDLRWKPPVRPEHRGTQVLHCIKNGAIPHQRALLFEEFMGALFTGVGLSAARTKVVTTAAKAVPVDASEDCLFLNIRVPAHAKDLPVMVWIHGGDQTDGSGSDPFYASNALPERGCVLVTINYRLGLFGWMAHPELEDEGHDGVSGNYGLLDQVAALEWVRDNIAAFGGDPERVTIFGESAGGQGVLNLMTTPLARGLFHGAIAESPSDSGRWLHGDRPFLGRQAARDAGRRFADTVVGNAPGQIERLRALPADELNEQYRTELAEAHEFYPNVDGLVLPTTPMTAFSNHQQAAVPLMIGWNANEGSLLAAHMHPAGPEFGPLPDSIDADAIRAAFVESYGSAEAAAEILAQYPGLTEQDPAAIDRHGADHMFGVHVDHASRQHALAGHQVHRYFFTALPPSENQTAGAFHAAEITYVFDTSIPMVPVADDAHLLVREMGDRWFAFAATGNPQSPGRDAWPAYHPDSSAVQMRFDRPVSEVIDCPAVPELDLMRARIERLNALSANAG